MKLPVTLKVQGSGHVNSSLPGLVFYICRVNKKRNRTWRISPIDLLFHQAAQARIIDADGFFLTHYYKAKPSFKQPVNRLWA